MPAKNYEESKPIVLVLLPTYQQAKSGLFESAVQSVLDQDFVDLELIIIDDGSTDGTSNSITRFMDSDKRVSCIRHRYNVGLPAISEYEGVMRAGGNILHLFLMTANGLMII